MGQKRVSIELEAKTDRAITELEALKAEIAELNQKVLESNKSTKKTLNEIDKNANTVAKGVKGIGRAIKGAGFGLLILAGQKIKELFEGNQIVLDAFSTAFEFISIAFNDFVNLVTSGKDQASSFIDSVFGNKIVQNIKEFSYLLGVEIITRVKNLIQGIGGLGKAIYKVFKGDFEGAYETATKAATNLSEVVTGNVEETAKVDETIKKVTKSVSNYARSVAASAAENVKLNKEARLAEVVNQGLIEKYDRQAEQLRQIRDDESKTIEERITANNKLAEVLDKQEKEMLENAQLRIKQAEIELSKNRDNLEAQIAYQEALNEKLGIEAQIDGFRSEQKTNVNSLERERIDLLDEAKEKEQERLDRIQELTNLEELTAQEKIDRDRQAALDELELLNATEEEKQKIRDFYGQKEIDLAKAVAQAKRNDAKSTLDQLAQIAGEGSAIGKAAAVASATISGIEGVQNAYTTAQKSPITTVFPAYPYVQAGLAAAFSAKQIQSIISTPSMGGGGGGASAGSAPASPSFNVVGAAPENQLAQTIGQQEDRPVKAYVVSQEVSSQQALDRNIESSASLG